MNNKENLKSLFSAFNGCLPCEYDGKYLDNGSTASILITKNNSGHIMDIATSVTNDDVLTVFSYDYGDTPDEDSEVFQWNLDSPDVTLDTILADIQNRF